MLTVLKMQDFGTAAGFYLNATNEKWKKHYNMEKYITEELPSLIKDAGLPLDASKASVFGHSMVRLDLSPQFPFLSTDALRFHREGMELSRYT